MLFHVAWLVQDNSFIEKRDLSKSLLSIKEESIELVGGVRCKRIKTFTWPAVSLTHVRGQSWLGAWWSWWLVQSGGRWTSRTGPSPPESDSSPVQLSKINPNPWVVGQHEGAQRLWHVYPRERATSGPDSPGFGSEWYCFVLTENTGNWVVHDAAGPTVGVTHDRLPLSKPTSHPERHQMIHCFFGRRYGGFLSGPKCSCCFKGSRTWPSQWQKNKFPTARGWGWEGWALRCRTVASAKNWSETRSAHSEEKPRELERGGGA